MTHAVPGQAGHHHVNCQPSDYWIDLIAQRGYSLSEDNDVFIEISRTNHTWNYFSRTGLVFVRDSASGRLYISGQQLAQRLRTAFLGPDPLGDEEDSRRLVSVVLRSQFE